MAVTWKRFAYYDEVHSGLFEIDVDGGLEPVTDVQADLYYELDVNDDIMPKSA